MIKAVIFDFDYTLGDSANGIVLSVNYALEQLGHSVRDITEIRKTIGLSLKDTYSVLTSRCDLGEAERFAKLFKEKADEVMVINTELYNGVKDVLKELKNKGYKIGIVTTKFHYRIEQILRKFEANELIDIIIGAEDVKMEKPDPEGLWCAMERLGLEKDDVLYVGDSLVDAQTAENAGVDFVGVLTGTTERQDFEKYRSLFIGKNIPDIYNFVLKYYGNARGIKNA